MGTNYHVVYHHPYLNDGKEIGKQHIGKRSNGHKFIWCPGIFDVKEIAERKVDENAFWERLSKGYCIIYDENSKHVSIEDFKEIVSSLSDGKDNDFNIGNFSVSYDRIFC